MNDTESFVWKTLCCSLLLARSLVPLGIPVLLPGEVITQAALDTLAAVKEGGGVVSGCSDASLATMRVVVVMEHSDAR